MGSIVHFAALLREPDVTANCVFETWQEKSSTGRVFTRARLAEYPPGLPDGQYTVEFAGHAVSIRRWHEN